MAVTRPESPARKPRAIRRERVRFPLAVKLFFLTTSLVALVVLLSIGLSIRRSNEVATEAVNRSISDAGDLFQEFQKNRLKELQLGATVVGNDVPFVSYIQEALYSQAGVDESSSGDVEDAAGAEAAEPPNLVVDTASILDALQQRRELLNTDLMILTDDQGILVARTDQVSISGGSTVEPVDLYETLPMLRAVVDGERTAGAGVILLDGRLYHAAVAPLSVGAARVVAGYMINAFAIDDHFANRIGRTTRAGVLFLPYDEGPRSIPVRSADAPNAEQIRSIAAMGPLFSGKRIGPETVTIDRSAYILTGEPLEAVGKTAGAVIFIRSLDEELAPFREIQRALTWAGGVTLLIAFLVSFLIAKRITRPIEDLAGMAQAITEGDYSVRPDFARSDEVGILSRSFGKMVSALRDKAELEVLYQEMAARVEQRPVSVTVAPGLETGTTLVTNLRGLPRVVDAAGAAVVIRLLADAMELQSSEVKRQDGRILEVAGDRLMSLFAGDRGVVHAVRAARAINEELALQMSERASLGIGAGIAMGDVVTGTVDAADSKGLAIVGDAPVLALLLGSAAPTGHAYISMEAAHAAGNEVLAASSREELHLKWLAAPVPVAGLPLQSVTTGMMQTAAAVTAGGTLRLDGTVPMVAEQASELTTGQVFAGRYEIESILGRGGMGVVYRARDTQLDESVAIKVLPNEVMRRSPEELERFKREIRLARKITHRNVLRTYDYGEAGGVYFISMEYIRGYALSELLGQTPQLAPRIAMGIARQICRGLQAAHEEGIIHRDIKPQNVLIDHRGEVKLMDFGIARMTESAEAMTAAGIVVGTPHYMSPEQVQGRSLDARSDVYSMGIMMFQMLCGKLPFDSTSLTAVLTAHITDKPEEPMRIRKEIGREINAIILRCLEKNPGKRYSDSGALLAELDSLRVTEPV